MNLRHLPDDTLLTNTKKAVVAEKEALTVVLYHLLEVERRRLFSSLKKPSLFEYAVEELGYSRHEAYDRIAAMKLLKEIPEIENKITSGSVNLTTLCMAKTFFNQERKENNSYNKEEKLGLIESLEHKSTREVEKMIFSLSSNPEPMKERVKTISEDLTEYKFAADEKLHNKINKLKALLSHRNPNISMAQLIDTLCDLGLQEYDPTEKMKKVEERKAKRQNAKKISVNADRPEAMYKLENTIHDRMKSQNQVNRSEVKQTKDSGKIRAPGKNLRFIPAAVKRDVWLRDQGKCINCGSTHGLQYDHIKPVAMGGKSEIENLRLLCRSCNQRAAIKVFGVDKMTRYLE